MSNLHIALALLALGSSLSAQAITSPKGFLFKEGNSNATFALGAYADGRFQYSDGTHLGSMMMVKGVGFRLGNYDYTASNGTGRAWTNVTILASECDGNALSPTFASNPKSTPSKVFDASVSWPTQVGKPQTFPDDFSIRFPFQMNWSYSGNDHICLEYQFTGGTLANSGAWNTANRPYYLDAQNTGVSSFRDSVKYGDFGPNIGCSDRSTSNVSGAEIWSRVTIYGPQYPTATLRDKLAFTQNGRYFPASKPVMTVLGVRSNPAGIDFGGITCNRVHIDVTLPLFFIPSFTQSNGSLVTLNLSADNPGPNVELVTQVIWNDTVTRQPLLSNAAAVVAPASPGDHPASLLYSSNKTNANGSRSDSRSYQPIVRYAR